MKTGIEYTIRREIPNESSHCRVLPAEFIHYGKHKISGKKKKGTFTTDFKIVAVEYKNYKTFCYVPASVNPHLDACHYLKRVFHYDSISPCDVTYKVVEEFTGEMSANLFKKLARRATKISTNQLIFDLEIEQTKYDRKIFCLASFSSGSDLTPCFIRFGDSGVLFYFVSLPHEDRLTMFIVNNSGELILLCDEMNVSKQQMLQRYLQKGFTPSEVNYLFKHHVSWNKYD